MKAIRAWHASMAYYTKLFRETADLSLKDFSSLKKSFHDTNRNAFDCTNRLMTLRENLSAAGYKEAVKKTDERFLSEHRGFSSEEDWENFWIAYCKQHIIPPYPEDAL